MYYKYNFCMCIANSLTVTHEALNPVNLVILKVHVSLCCHLSVKRFVRKGIPAELRAQVTEQGYCMTLYSIFILVTRFFWSFHYGKEVDWVQIDGYSLISNIF